MANKKISELPSATEPLNDADLVEVVQGGINKKAPKSAFGGGAVDSVTGDGVDNTDPANPVINLSGFGIIRDFGRTFSAEDVFDANEITYEDEELTGDIEFTVAGSGHLTDQFCVSVRRISTDGTHKFTWTGFDETSDIPNEEVLPAGTYQIFHFYRNGITTASLHPATGSGSSKLQTIEVTNGATGTTDLNCLGLDQVKFLYTVTVTGNITITKSNDDNTEIINIIIPVTGSGIEITLPSDVRMARYQENIIWNQSGKVLTVSSVGTSDLHELSLNRAGEVYILRYDGPVRA